jgi:hypothetical protein
MRTAAFALLTLVGFAFNSILCRMALGPRLVDAATFTGVRLATGAVAPAVLASLSGSRGEDVARAARSAPPSRSSRTRRRSRSRTCD